LSDVAIAAMAIFPVTRVSFGGFVAAASSNDQTRSCRVDEMRFFPTGTEPVAVHAGAMSLPPEPDRFLRRLSAATLPCAVEGFESIDLVRTLVHAQLLQAILPPWDEASRSYSGPAWVVRLTQKGINAAGQPGHRTQS
jgi:hypothetical protein